MLDLCSLLQLNIYGFHKTRHDEDSCEFKQPNFRRGLPHLVGLIRRKGQSSKSASAAGGSRQAESTPSSKVIYSTCASHSTSVAGECRTEWVETKLLYCTARRCMK